ncbi:MAG TPA: ABC transporter permease [Jatrophihabitans sp.]|jgi:osmoprotectant transport system permease protein
MSGTVLADAGLPGIGRVGVWFNDPQNWWGPFGLLVRIREHLIYTGIILVIAIAIALPLGLLVGHTGKGVFLVVGSANGLRAIPTLGFVVLLYILFSSSITTTFQIPYVVDRGGLASFVAVLIVLVLLALPPILTSTYAGVQNIDPAVRDAARGMGMTGGQVVRQVEFPMALPLIMSGIRSAALQVIATVTVAAYLPFLGGLGRYIKDGAGDLYNLQDGYPAMLAAGITVAVLAILVDAMFNVVQRYVVSPGLTGRATRTRPEATGITTDQATEAQLTNA